MWSSGSSPFLPLNIGNGMVGLWLMFFRVLVRAFTKSSVVRVMTKSGPLLTESLELVDSLCGIGSLGGNGLLGVSGLSVGERVSPEVLSGDGLDVSSGILFNIKRRKFWIYWDNPSGLSCEVCGWLRLSSYFIFSLFLF